MESEQIDTVPANPEHEDVYQGHFIKTETAFRLANGPSSYFIEWMAAARISWVNRDDLIPHQVLSQFKVLEVFTLTKTVLSLVATTLEPQLLQSVRAWASSNHTQLTDDDPHLIVQQWPLLSAAFRQLRLATERNADEANLRQGVDFLIEIAINWSTNHAARFLVEQHIQLPRTPPSANISKTTEAYTITDALVIVEINDDIVGRLRREILLKLGLNVSSLEDLHWQHQLPLEMSFIVFACEFKGKSVKANHNQVLYDLVAAQHHRCALGLPERPISGASFFRGVLSIISMWWEDTSYGRMLQAHIHIRTFRLTDPIDFINTYTFLNKLAHDVKNLGGELQTQNVQATVAAALKHQWRAIAPARHAGWSSNSCSDIEGAAVWDDEESEVDDEDADQNDIASPTPPAIAMLVSVPPSHSVSLPQKVEDWLRSIEEESADRTDVEGSSEKPL